MRLPFLRVARSNSAERPPRSSWAIATKLYSVPPTLADDAAVPPASEVAALSRVAIMQVLKKRASQRCAASSGLRPP